MHVTTTRYTVVTFFGFRYGTCASSACATHRWRFKRGTLQRDLWFPRRDACGTMHSEKYANLWIPKRGRLRFDFSRTFVGVREIYKPVDTEKVTPAKHKPAAYTQYGQWQCRKVYSYWVRWPSSLKASEYFFKSILFFMMLLMPLRPSGLMWISILPRW